MIAQSQVFWHTLDMLARERGFTPSALARAAGLDATALNPSRRVGAGGVMRWPSLPTLLRVLDVLQVPLAVFARSVAGEGLNPTMPDEGGGLLRTLAYSMLQQTGVFDQYGLPCGPVWEHEASPGQWWGEPDAYVVRVDTDGMEPVVRDGGAVVVVPSLPLREGDRVLLHGPGREPVMGLMLHGPEGPAVCSFRGGEVHAPPAREDKVWVHRIVMMTV
ncbi:MULTISPECIES: helix-turn-helix transcriptional regulator [Acetobacter]|jgi:DNA-binding phage protein|uniref:DNA-binding phage protein n=1 Tax=Acetobacter lovaniensis TaxID=104100 RepID=A0A841QCB9_9PROT|nr:helix-turn-helix transcriptional regulator [Acetobacter lovaniensis]MBB6456046.1 DNA-binding phage protein [Acetobacter lovaniensis]MCI1697024.1 helix-turn-helix transcriptional regulator [Acetobacter lovaniensis]MCI1795257.1 helix-turn-helix transcriptional regulator [Acetobacter lovaniensis]MCP1238124.1 helix-turn-helix transcriptional regulator [Acetobacter lovaniensis]NHN80434.1 helix-turn-helix transcriptional regulator [Acetobacter lovaniensis]